MGELSGNQLCSHKFYVKTVKEVAHSYGEKDRGIYAAEKGMKTVEDMEENPNFR